jgi:acyl-coenzyme A synthetase/AMP-(fatty) acid ligase
MNLVDLIFFQCKYHAPGAAMCAPGTAFNVVSYARLELLVHNISRKAVSLGLAPGNTVAIFIKDDIFHAAMILGLMHVGVITLSGRNPTLPKELRIDAIITDAPFPYANVGRIILADATWTMGDGRPLLPTQVYRGSGDDICRLILTSGTTGEPKAVGITHKMLFARISRHTTVYGNRLPQCSRTYCDLGFATSLGFQFLIYILSRGGTIFFLGDTPDGTFQAFELYKVQNMVSSPAGYAHILRFYESRVALQCGMEMLLSGGSLLSKSLSERIRARMCTNLVSSYGSTEASIVATAPAHIVADIPGAVGFVTPGVSVEIVDDRGKALPPAQEGAVRIRSPFGADGYLGDPEETAKSFRDGWFYPGDLGYLTGENILVISGRQTAILNLGGDKVKPETVEEVLVSFDAVHQAAAFNVANELGVDELWALIVPKSPLDEKALRGHCEQKLPRSFVPIRFVTVDELPVNDMGKVERQRLPEIAKSNSA